MNYYIQGDAANSDKIKAAFEKLGYDISWPGGCANADVINIGVERNGAKYVVAETSEYIKDIIKTHPDYKELELPVEPKFKVGDWIVRWDDAFTVSIKSVRDVNYYFNQGGSLHIKEVDEYYHLWTIADAKDGDVLAANECECYVIFKEIDGLNIKCYCTYHYMGFNPSFHIFTLQNKTAFRPATPKERTLLFTKMKEEGYQWDAGKKELRKIKPHYDISNFRAGMPVLVRDGEGDDDEWTYALFSHYNSNRNEYKFSASGDVFLQCIPFEGNEHLLGTTDMCDEQYINW